MDHWDRTGLVAACLALAMASAAWLVDLGPSDHAETAAIDHAAGMALESTAVGQPFTWYSRRTGSQATIIPASAYRDGTGRWCRAYSVAIARDARPEPPIRQIACRDGLGQWSRVVTGEQVAVQK
jgi:surface antigen